MKDAEVERLIAAFHDHQPEGAFYTNCGLVDYVPARDFPVPRRAVEALVERGAAVVPRMRELIAQPRSIEAYFAIEVLGRLGVREVIPELEAIERDRVGYSRRVNFDQYVEYEVFRQATEALARLRST